MKLKHLIETILPTNVEDVMDLIRKDCQSFLSQTREPLYRGSKLNTNELIRKEVVRMDRKPSDTPSHISDVVDNALKGVAGFKPRSQALFCTGDIKQAKGYGSVYLVFPIGDFKFIWSEHIPDLYTYLVMGVTSNTITNIMMKIMIDVLKEKYSVKDVREIPFIKTDKSLLDSLKDMDHSYIFGVLDKDTQIEIIKRFFEYKDWYETDDLETAIGTKNEIMIHCKDYYMVSLSVLESLGYSVEEFMGEL